MQAAGGTDAGLSARTRLLAGAGAVACAALVAAVPALAVPALAALGALGVLLVAGAAWRWAALLGPGIAILGVEVLFVLPRAAWPPWAAAAASGLFLTAELAAWAGEASPAVNEEPRVRQARVRTLLTLVPGLALVSTLVLAFAAAAPPGDVARLAVGVGAGTALLGLLAWLARRVR